MAGAATMPPRWSQRHPYWAMWLDFALAMVLMLFLTFLAMAGWGAWRAITVLRSADVSAADSAELMQRVGEPGAAVLMVSGSVAMALAAWGVYLLRRRASAAEIATVRSRLRQARPWLESTGLGLGFFLFSTALLWTLDQWQMAPTPTNLPMILAVQASSPWLLLWLVVLVAPLGEELLFRRVMFARLWAAGHARRGMWLTGAVFALMHEFPTPGDEQWQGTLILLLFYAAMGAAFAWIYHRHQAWWTAVVAHATNNACASAMLLAGYAS
ncbi:CPBP family intramembrane glutamic endopeptidase [Luteimonas sp. e5]